MDAIRLFIEFVLPPILAVVLALHWRRNHQSIRKGFGFTFNRFSIRDLIAGFFITGLGMLGIFLVELLLNAIQVTGTQFDLGAILGNLGSFAGFALYEEVFFRSFLLSALVVLLKGNKWLAILISAALFGFTHLSSPNATLVTAFGNALGGVIYGIAFLGAKNIWLPWGLHIGWNFFQALLGFPVSGQNLAGLLTLNTTGSEALTEGGFWA